MLFRISQSLQFLRNVVIAFGLSTLTVCAQPVVTPPPFVAPPSGGGGPSTPFALPNGHAPFYVATAANGGSDSNDGLAPTVGGGHGPWLTGNHSISCGDIITSTSLGAYNQALNTWGTVVNCPSTTGGIDGTGGIWAAVFLCSPPTGDDLGTNGCQVNCATAACAGGHVGSGTGSALVAMMNINNNNWAIINWNGNANGNEGFQMDACLTQTTIIHDVYFINTVVTNAAQAWDMGDGCGYNINVPGNGADYAGSVGGIAQNAAQFSVCASALDFVSNAAIDSLPGTHLYAKDNFIWGSQSSGQFACKASDIEAMMWDTPDVHGYNNQAVFDNNVAWNNFRYGIQIFNQHRNPTSATAIIHNNTFYNNNRNTDTSGTPDFLNGEINLAQAPGGTATTTIVDIVQKNIAQVTVAASPVGGGHINALNQAMVPNGGAQTIGGTGSENILKAAMTSCVSTACQGPNFEISCWNGLSCGTNFETDPLFANTTDLTNNWFTKVPNCTGFPTTTACMGYNVATKTLTANTPIADLQASCTNCSGKGYQLPSSTCNTNSEFPSHMKGLVRISAVWSGGVIIGFNQMHDLSTTPCGF